MGWTLDGALDILSEDLIIFGLFLFSTGMTLLCTPCCIHLFCGKAMANAICSIALMMIAVAMIAAVMMFSEWFIAIVALICGVLFAFGEIAFVFLDGVIVKYVHSRQYGMTYGLLQSARSVARAVAPYTFYVVFDIFSR